jgi:hypothetical protein
MPDPSAWALPNGLPSAHIARAALHAAAVIDRRGSPTADARESYWHHATGGSFPPVDLRRGERLLIDCGLLIDHDGTLVPTLELEQLLAGSAEEALAALCQHALETTRPAWLASGVQIAELADRDSDAADAISEMVPDAERREELLLALGRRFDDALRRAIGAIGEDLVVQAARTELQELGHADLARRVRRVSLTSDQLGYDVSAPRLGGTTRLLEVKTTTATRVSSTVALHLTRGEAQAGLRLRDWALVVCAVENIERREGRIVGWCPHDALAEALPRDTPTGHWEQARIDLEVTQLMPALPSPVA